MEVSISSAEGQLDELVRLAEVGGEVVLTLDGWPVARFVPVKPLTDSEELRALAEELQRSLTQKLTSGSAPDFPCAAALSGDLPIDKNGPSV